MEKYVYDFAGFLKGFSVDVQGFGHVFVHHVHSLQESDGVSFDREGFPGQHNKPDKEGYINNKACRVHGGSRD